MMNTKTFLLLFVLTVSCVSALKCWKGSSSEIASDYPPEWIDCTGENYVCERNFNGNLDFYTQSCVSAASCQRDYDLVKQGISTIYDQVLCCSDKDGCNAYPGQDVSNENNVNNNTQDNMSNGILFIKTFIFAIPFVIVTII